MGSHKILDMKKAMVQVSGLMLKTHDQLSKSPRTPFSRLKLGGSIGTATLLNC